MSACASPRQIHIKVSDGVAVCVALSSLHQATWQPSHAACVLLPTQPTAMTGAPAPRGSSEDHAHQFIRDAPNAASIIRVPSGPESKAESKPSRSSQSHRMQYLLGRVGVFFLGEFQFFIAKKYYTGIASLQLSPITCACSSTSSTAASCKSGGYFCQLSSYEQPRPDHHPAASHTTPSGSAKYPATHASR